MKKIKVTSIFSLLISFAIPLVFAEVADAQNVSESCEIIEVDGPVDVKGGFFIGGPNTAEITNTLDAPISDTSFSVLNALRISRALISNQNYQEARDLLVAVGVVVQTRFDESDFEYLAAIDSISLYYYQTGDLVKAALGYRYLSNFQLENNILTSENGAVTVYNVGNSLVELGDYSRAEQYFTCAWELEKTHRGEKTINAIRYWLGVASALTEQGNFLAAEKIIVEAISVLENELGADDPFTLEANNSLGYLYSLSGNFIESKRLYELVYQFRKRKLGHQNDNTLTSLNNLGFIHQQMGEFALAEPYYRRALKGRILLLGRSHPSTIESINNIGYLFLGQRLYEEALPWSREAYELRQLVLGPLHPRTLESAGNLAVALMHLDREAEAESIFIGIINSLSESGAEENIIKVQILGNLSGLYIRRGDYAEAQEYALQSYEIAERILPDDHPNRALAQNNLAVSYLKLGNIEEAKRLLGEAATYFEGKFGLDHSIVANVLANLIFASSLAEGTSEDELVDLATQGLLSFSTLLEREQLSAPSDTSTLALLQDTSMRDLAISVALRFSGRQELAAKSVLWTKGISGEIEASQRRISELEPDLRNLVRELQNAEASLYHAQLSGDASLIRSRLEERNSLRQVLARRSKEYAAAIDFTAVTPAKVSEVLPPDSVFLDFAVFRPVDVESGKALEPRIMLALYENGSEVEIFDLGPYTEVESDIEILSRINEFEIFDYCSKNTDFQCPAFIDEAEVEGLLEFDELSNPLSGEDTIYIAVERLGESLLSAVAERLDDKDLVISPDGQLSKINFGLLWLEGRPLIKNHEISTIPNGRTLFARSTESIAQVDLLPVGGATYGPVADPKEQILDACTRNELRSGSGFCPLPYAEFEASELASLAAEQGLSVRDVLVGSDATEVAVKQAMPGTRIVHLATHAGAGFSDTTSGLNDVALAFSGANLALYGESASGLLSGYEASRIPLHSTEVVTLSACGTARGSSAYSEGFYSLAYAFRLAGAENVLMSLWSIDDEATARFMLKFYENWFRRRENFPNENAGVSMRRALRETTLNSMSSGESWMHYGAFVLVENRWSE